MTSFAFFEDAPRTDPLDMPVCATCGVLNFHAPIKHKTDCPQRIEHERRAREAGLPVGLYVQ